VPKTCCRIGLALLAGLAGLWLAMPAHAAVTLTDGQAVPGLEPRPGEGLWWTRLSDAQRAAEHWFWYHVAVDGLPDGHPEEAVPAVADLADLADLLATESGADWPLWVHDVAASEAEAIIRTTGTGWHGGTALETWPVDLRDWEEQTVVGMRVGRADVAGPAPAAPQTAALSVMGGGLALGLVVRRRRT